MTAPSNPPKQTRLLVTLVAGIAALLVIMVVLLVVVIRRPSRSTEVFSAPATVLSSTTSTPTTATTVAPVTVTVTVSAVGAPVTTPVPPTTVAVPPTTSPARPAPQAINYSSLSVDGLAPLTMGMTLGDAMGRTGLGSEISQCGSSTHLAGVLPDVYVTFDDGRLSRIHVKNPSVRTLSGISVGTSVAELRRKLPALIETPSPYAQLTLHIFRSQDGARELVFWVGDGAVTSMVVAFGDDGEGEGC